MTHDLRETIEFYDQLLSTAANDREAVGWRSPHGQEAAFLALTRIDGFGDGVKILDVGCGVGGLLTFLKKKGHKVRYTGIDINENMIAAAKVRHPKANFIVADILAKPFKERFDFVFCSGVLAFKHSDSDTYIKDMITAMYSLCDIGLAFNAPSSHRFVTQPGQPRSADTEYQSPGQLFTVCHDLSEYVTVSQGGSASQISVYVYRKNVAAFKRFCEDVGMPTEYDDTAKAIIGYAMELDLWEELRSFLLRLHPTPAVSFYLGEAFEALGDDRAAETHYRTSILDAPDVVLPYIRLANLYIRTANLPRAIQIALDAVRIAPTNVRGYEVLVHALLANKEAAEARATAETAPEDVVGFYLRARTAESKEAALGFLDRALALDPSYLPALSAKAETLEATNHPIDALEVWRTVHAITPSDATVSDHISALAGS